ncbi:MAG: IS1380 family transposase [Ktedonobacterales bacterium]
MCGYEDQDDADTLRTDPLLKLVCGRAPEQATADLASQPTLSRLENAVNARTCYRLAAALLGVYVRERERASGVPTHLVLDLDGTDDPTHGDQEGSAYHGYYRQHMYHPLLIFDGETDQLLTAVLRPGTVHASRGVVAVLKRIVRRLRARWPATTIELRADSGFAVPALYEWCEAEGIAYTLGLATNARLAAQAEPLRAQAEQQRNQTGEKVRLVGEMTYAAATWTHPRRVVYKAAALAQGPNVRFVVTTRTDPPLTLYHWYIQRGRPEQWIDDLKRACFADRLSCHRFWANQFRLLLHAAAYWLLDTLRRWLRQLGIAPLRLDTLRLRLLKIGGWVRHQADGFRLHLASSHPAEPLWRLLTVRFQSP